MRKSQQFDSIQVISIDKILTQYQSYEQILDSLKNQQKLIFRMCQSHNDYQLMKQQLRQKLSYKNPITSLAILSVIKSILTGVRHPLIKFEGLFEERQSDNNILSSQNYTQTLFTQTQNPFSHLLCFRLLKQALIYADYALLTLVQTELSELIFNVAIFDSNNENHQRGRALYLQGLTSNCRQIQLPMTLQQMEHVGYSVHIFALQIILVLGNQSKTLPYHVQSQINTQIFVNQNEKKGLQMHQIGTNQQIQKCSFSTFNLLNCIQNYSFQNFESKWHKLYKKTKQLKIQYADKLHYFKHQEIQKIHKRLYFNSERNFHHIQKFYQILFGLSIKKQIHSNKKTLNSVEKLNQKQFNQYLHHYKRKQQSNGFLFLLRNILKTNDRYAFYWTTIHIIKTLKIFKQKTNYEFQEENNINMFFSLCQSIDYLTISIKLRRDEKQNIEYLELKAFNFQMYKVLDFIIGQPLFQFHQLLFNQGNNKNKITQTYFYFREYTKSYFYYLLSKIKISKQAITQALQKSSQKKKEKIDFNISYAKQGFFTGMQKKLGNDFSHHKTGNSHLHSINITHEGHKLLKRLESIKSKFSIELQKVKFQHLQIHKDVTETIKNKQELILTNSLLQLLKIQVKKVLNKFERKQLTKDNITQNNFQSKKFLKFHKDIVNEQQQNLKQNKCHHFQLQQHDIPKQFVKQNKTIQSYKFKTSSNDISKIHLKISRNRNSAIKGNVNNQKGISKRKEFPSFKQVQKIKVNSESKSVQTYDSPSTTRKFVNTGQPFTKIEQFNTPYKQPVFDKTQPKQQRKIQFSNSSFKKSQVHSILKRFYFPTRLKREIMKKKVLLLKDQAVEIGMITKLQQVSLQNNKNLSDIQYHSKLVSTLYITPLLSQVLKIQLEIKCPAFLSSNILSNKTKQNIQEGLQYTSIVEFFIQKLQQLQNQIQNLPFLNIKMAINQNQQKTQKNYKLKLPLFLNKFFSELTLNQDETKKLAKTLQICPQMYWIDLSPNLIKQFEDLTKYFLKLQTLKEVEHQNLQKLKITKIKFKDETVFVCFKKLSANISCKTQQKRNSILTNFLIIGENQINQMKIENRFIHYSKENYLENIIFKTYLSLLSA